jgi:hypothetical protein
MKNYPASALILLLVASTPGCVTTPTAADDQSNVYNALLANCLGAPGAPPVKFGKEAEIALIEAFRMGPPTAFLAEMAESRHEEFAAIQQQLAGEDRELFDASLVKQVQAISEETYVTEGIDQTILGFKLSALDGLAAVGTKTTIQWLERTAPKIESPQLRAAAERTLNTLRGR